MSANSLEIYWIIELDDGLVLKKICNNHYN